MPIRRHCDPINIKRIWDAIRYLGVQHLSCDISRITKYFQKIEDCTQAQVEQYIQQALQDGMISARNTMDLAISTYKIIDQQLPEFDGKDWYCFECHLAGDVISCNECFRVFHKDCIKTAKKKFEIQKSSYQKQIGSSELNSSIKNNGQPLEVECDVDLTSSSDSSDEYINNYVYNENLCSICNIINIDQCDLEKAEVNYLLRFVLHRVRAWLPDTITHTMAEEDRPAFLTDTELTWRANQLFFEHRDMSVIEVNLNTNSYSVMSEFLADILTVQHNVAIFHGMESQEYQAAEYVVRDTLHDISELKNCSDCYRHSNEKINLKWFTLPCRRSHKLVWAKQKGYPYWPAKVIRESPTHCDVRFFGGKHERSLIPKSSVKPIETTKEALKVKQSSAFMKSYEELKYHQKLLSDPKELEKVRSDVKGKKSLRPKNLTPLDNSFSSGGSLNLSFNSENSAIASPAQKRNKRLSDMSNGRPEAKKSRTDSVQDVADSVINISDCEEEEPDYSFRSNVSQNGSRFDDHQQVSSSTENCTVSSHDAEMQQLDQPYSDSVEKMRRRLETLADRNVVIRCAMNCMQQEIDRITNDHNDHLKRLFESHNAQISETKKKQWCYNCEQDAIYHCCWNTAYCSQTCQQQHWQAEHKKVCRRKRQN